MKFSQILAYLSLCAAATNALPTEEAAGAVTNTNDLELNTEASANLPGLNALQSKYASAIIAEAKKVGVGAHGCQAGIATALVEVPAPPIPSPGTRYKCTNHSV